MKKPVVLLVDDHVELRETVEATLKNDGYDVTSAGNIHELKLKLPSAGFDIVLLDLGLPDGDGLTMIAKIREHSDVPIIVISGKNDMTDKVVGLEMGADDYVGKPLPLKELSSRIKAQLRRYASMQERVKNTNKGKGRVAFGSWVLDRNRMQVFEQDGTGCGLTAKEFRLLETLVDAPNCVLSRVQILAYISPDNLDITDRAIDIQVMRIRKKIGDTDEKNQVIQTVRGVGYMLSAKTTNVD
jgi:two-component system OmpR family response regulator